MAEPTTFDESDWRELAGPDKKALRTFSRVAIDFEPLAKAYGVGQKSMDVLMSKGLDEEGESSLHGRRFRIARKEWLAVEWLQSRRTGIHLET